MSPRFSARFELRDATASWHDRVDAIYSAVSLSDGERYGRFLLAQAAAHLPAEQALELGGISGVIADWPARRRADLVEADLGQMGLPLPMLEARPVLTTTPALLGAIYVLEGSRLGGALLARSVANHLPTGFLTAGRPAAWRTLTALLDARLASHEDMQTAISAACDVFALFERSGRRHL